MYYVENRIPFLPKKGHPKYFWERKKSERFVNVQANRAKRKINVPPHIPIIMVHVVYVV